MKPNNKNLSDLKALRKSVNTLSTQVEDLIFQHQLVTITETIKVLKKKGQTKKITTAFLQKKFQIGFAHASRLLDKI